jgi:hypothetical protein
VPKTAPVTGKPGSPVYPATYTLPDPSTAMLVGVEAVFAS